MLMTKPYRVVVADDSIPFRNTLKRFLEEEADFDVIGEAGDGLELINLLNRLVLNKQAPHLIILDISMPHLSGIEATSWSKLNYPDIKVLILTMHRDKGFLCQALSHGANGYLLKDDVGRDLFSAIDLIRQGETYISPLLFPLAVSSQTDRDRA